MKTHLRLPCLCLILLSILFLFPANAVAKCPIMGYHTVATNELFYGINLISLLWGGKCFNDDTRAVFLNEYDRYLARFCGADVHLVTGAWLGERAFALTCRRGDSTNVFRIEVTLVCNEADKIVSVVFDRDLSLPGGVSVRHNQPVPLETVMHAIALERHARSTLGAHDLAVKTLSGSLSCKKPTADRLSGKTIIRGSAPTSVTSFRTLTNFSIAAFLPGDTNVLARTFALDNWGIGGNGKHVDMVYAGSFYLVPDLGHTKPIARFHATINKGRVYFDYKIWTVNPSNAILSQVQYEGLQNDFKTNKPSNGICFGAVTFALDSELHVITNLPLSVKTTTSGYKLKNIKMKP